jgi:hypothetical protein
MMMAKKKRDRHPSMRHLVVALDSLDLGNSEADQMATLDMSNETSGVAAENFGESPNSNQRPQGSASDEPGVARSKRRKQPRGAKVDARASGRKSRPKNTPATPPVIVEDRSSEPDTESVARGETFVGQRWKKSAGSLTAALAATSRQQRIAAAGVGIAVLVVVFAVVFRGDSTTQDGPIAAEETVTRDSESPSRITHGDNDSLPMSDQVVDLFDGKSLEGWESEGGDDWTVEDGILTGSGNTLLVYTKETFEGARVTVECRVPAGSNSGVILRHEFGEGWQSGYEAQISSDQRQATMTGGIFGLQNVNAQLVPHNVWFTLEFEAVGERLEVSVNGQTTAVATSSKFSSGHVAIQSIGTSHFRKVQVQRLSSVETLDSIASGWADIFNDRDLVGWKNHGDSNWTVSAGILHAGPGPHGWLLTQQSYADYEFECEFRMTYGANSGVLIHADPALSLTGVNIAEIQLLDTSNPQYSKISAKASHGGRNRRSSGRFGRAWESVDIDLALKGLHGENIGRRW